MIAVRARCVDGSGCKRYGGNSDTMCFLRQVWAVVLLVVMSVSLVPLPVSADAEAKLPACCRRGDGKHGCAMSGMRTEPVSSGPAWKATSRCPLFPNGSVSPVASNSAVTGAPLGLITLILRELHVAAMADAQYRVSFSRTRQKRGPPVLS